MISEAEREAELLAEFKAATQELHAAEVKAQELLQAAKDRYARALQAMHRLALSAPSDTLGE